MLFNSAFILTLIFSNGLNAYSNYNSFKVYFENSTETNCGLDKVISDTNFMDEDLIDHTFDTFVAEVTVSHIPFHRNCLCIPVLSFSVWQPPKIS